MRAAAQLLDTPRGHRTLATAVLLVAWLACTLLVAPAAIRERPVIAIVAALVALAGGWVVAGLVAGRERWLVAGAAALAVVRVPVPTGDGTAMLLLPLYAAIGLGALVVVRRGIDDLRAATSTDGNDRGGATRMLDVGACAVPAIALLSVAWSVDREASLRAVAFFLLPFLLGYLVMRCTVRTQSQLALPAGAFVASALVAALVGLYQAAARVVWWNPKVVDANSFRADFRTNSVFWDPNIYGRVLVVALLVLVAWALVARLSRARRAMATLAGAVLVLALWNTYSQSSWFALAAALALLALLTLPPRPRRWAGAALAAALLLGAPLALDALSGRDVDGRVEVARVAVALAADRPVGGWGVGTFEHAARERAEAQGERRPRLVASHATPATVFAELGVFGLGAYVVLLTSTIVAILARWKRPSTEASAARGAGVAPEAPGWPELSIVWASAAFVAILAHSLLYAGFFEDPLLWIALAVLASLPGIQPDERSGAATDQA